LWYVPDRTVLLFESKSGKDLCGGPELLEGRHYGANICYGRWPHRLAFPGSMARSELGPEEESGGMSPRCPFQGLEEIMSEDPKKDRPERSFIALLLAGAAVILFAFLTAPLIMIIAGSHH